MGERLSEKLGRDPASKVIASAATYLPAGFGFANLKLAADLLEADRRQTVKAVARWLETHPGPFLGAADLLRRELLEEDGE